MFNFEDWYQNIVSRYRYRWEFMRHSTLFREHCKTVLDYNDNQRLVFETSPNYTAADKEISQAWNLPAIPSPLDHTRMFHLPTFKELLQGWLDDLEDADESPSVIINGKAPDHRTLLLDLAKSINEPGDQAQPRIRVNGPFERDNSISLYIQSPHSIDLEAFYSQLEKADPPLSVAEIKEEDSGNFVYIRLNLPGLPMKPSGVDDQAFEQEAIKKIAPLVHAVEKALSYRDAIKVPVSIFGQRETTGHLDSQLQALEGLADTDNPARTLRAAQEKIKRLEDAVVDRLKVLDS